MQSTPTEAAATQFAEQQVAFERARRKLTAARAAVGSSASVPKTQPHNAVELFFRRVNAPLKHCMLSELVLSDDLQPAPRRSLPDRLARAQRADRPADPRLIEYWTDLTRDDLGRPNRWHFVPSGFRQSVIADDLVLVSFKLKRTPHRPTRDWTVIGLCFVPGVVLATYAAMYVHALLFVAVLLLISHGPTEFLRYKDKKDSQEFTVRKLLIRSGGQWLLFCADWEAYEEADLSWLDLTTEEASHVARGSQRESVSPTHAPRAGPCDSR